MNNNAADAVSVEVRLNNTIYKCQLDGQWHEYKKNQPYAVKCVAGLNQNPDGSLGVQLVAMIICKTCFKDDPYNLDFKEPSNIVLPNPGDVKPFSLKNLKRKN